MTENSESYVRVHPKFKLNGISHGIESLKSQAYDFIKEGEPYEEAVGSFILDWLNSKSYVEVHTSGSTGSPKAIKVKKIHMVNSAKATAKHFDLPEKTTALLCLPAYYIAGKMMLVRAMTLGWRLDMTQPKTNPLDNVYRRYDFCAMTPLQLDNSLSRLHLLKKLIVGGGAISPALFLRVQDAKTKVYETYGMTETVTHIAARRVNSKKEKLRPIPFKALSKVTLGQDDRGCLIVKAPKVSSDPVITNDLVELLTYKKFFYLGRIDNVVNSGGVKLFPEQIEYELAPEIDVPFFVAGVPDDALGQKLVLVLETEGEYAFAKADFAFSSLEKLHRPKDVYTIPKFERTSSGKIKRGETLLKILQK